MGMLGGPLSYGLLIDDLLLDDYLFDPPFMRLCVSVLSFCISSPFLPSRVVYTLRDERVYPPLDGKSR